MILTKRQSSTNRQIRNCDLFEDEPFACNVVVRQDAEFSTRSDRQQERSRRYVVPYLARVTFDKNSELLSHLFDTPRWMVSVGRLPANMDEFFDPDSWWVTLYCSIVFDTWRNVDTTEARDAFPDAVIQWVISECMVYHFYYHGGTPCPQT